MSQDSRSQQAVGELDWKSFVNRVRAGTRPNADLAEPTEKTAGGHLGGTAVIQIRGIAAVADAAAVQPRLGTGHGDDELAATAAECLAWVGVMSADAVKVDVEDGWITLTGQVEWTYQRNLAEQSVGWISGVVGVSNRTVIKPPVMGLDICEELRDALGQSWFCDPAGIVVAAEAGTVQLSGTVQSPLHRRVAGELAWGIRGVSAVENAIVVLDDRAGDAARCEASAEGRQSVA